MLESRPSIWFIRRWAKTLSPKPLLVSAHKVPRMGLPLKFTSAVLMSGHKYVNFGKVVLERKHQ